MPKTGTSTSETFYCHTQETFLGEESYPSAVDTVNVL